MADKSYDLEDRLLDYAAQIIGLTENLRAGSAAAHIGNQLLRAGTSPYLNHGEAEAAESRNDFIHKLSICLKELREAKRALRLVKRVPLARDLPAVDAALEESDELIRIFAASIRTARKRMTCKEQGFVYDSQILTSALDVERSAFSVSAAASTRANHEP